MVSGGGRRNHGMWMIRMFAMTATRTAGSTGTTTGTGRT